MDTQIFEQSDGGCCTDSPCSQPPQGRLLLSSHAALPQCHVCKPQPFFFHSLHRHYPPRVLSILRSRRCTGCWTRVSGLRVVVTICDGTVSRWPTSTDISQWVAFSTSGQWRRPSLNGKLELELDNTWKKERKIIKEQVSDTLHVLTSKQVPNSFHPIREEMWRLHICQSAVWRSPSSLKVSQWTQSH